MKRIIITLCVFLLLGAVVNVAVAWGFAWCADAKLAGDGIAGITLSEHGATEIVRADWMAVTWLLINDTQRRTSPSSPSTIEKALGDAWGNAVSNMPRADDIRPRWGRVASVTSDFTQLCTSYPGEVVTETQFVFASGWPKRCAWCHLSYELAGPETRTWQNSAGAIFGPTDNTPVDVNNPRLLPIRPLWPGFAINTLFYATTLWLLFAGPGTVRRWRRIRRGLCAKCAYPVGTSDVCTECGAAIASGRRPARA